MRVQYRKPSPWSEVILAPGLLFSTKEEEEGEGEEKEEEGRRSIIHISKFFNITVEDKLELEVEGSRRITDCLRFSNRITSPGVSFVSIIGELEGPAGG
jgi:hypothetical protein